MNLKEAAKDAETDDREEGDIVGLVNNNAAEHNSLYDKTFTMNDQTHENDTKSA